VAHRPGGFCDLLRHHRPVQGRAGLCGLTKAGDTTYCRRMAVKGTVIAGSILLLFGIWGDDLLRLLGISLPALQIGAVSC
jgi:small neutral amino acid transporter SnatA (MarC family)